MPSSPPCPESASSSGCSRGCGRRRTAWPCPCRDRPSAGSWIPGRRARRRARAGTETKTGQRRFSSPSSSDYLHEDPLDDVMVVAGGVVDQLLDLSLSRARGGARHDGERAPVLRRHGQGKFAEREAPEVAPELGALPSAAIEAHLHPVHPRAAVEGD